MLKLNYAFLWDRHGIERKAARVLSERIRIEVVGNAWRLVHPYGKCRVNALHASDDSYSMKM